MEKSKFEKFIGKYNLNRSCEQVSFVVDKGSMTVRAQPDDKNVLCEVVGPTFDFPVGNYAVYETARLSALLSVLGETLTVSTITGNTGIVLSDKRTEVTFVLADDSVIPDVPALTKLPPFELTIKLDDQFIASFIKSRSALKDAEAETFVVSSTGTDATATISLGVSDKNTNRIKLEVPTESAVKLDKLSFSAKYLRDILMANKDVANGKLEVSSRGLARCTFTADGITATYHLLKI